MRRFIACTITYNPRPTYRVLTWTAIILAGNYFAKGYTVTLASQLSVAVRVIAALGTASQLTVTSTGNVSLKVGAVCIFYRDHLSVRGLITCTINYNPRSTNRVLTWATIILAGDHFTKGNRYTCITVIRSS